ncbi:class II fructose-bisphosphate aldolase [Brevibacillus parabrevis]|uniref:class II fructose-bisphosphate aldolase n=1 Tax=Brevibacillus parabrevis TaxID=54914 RepID=UPI001C222AED|nr:class II fructose-bisphosphate aldolase [Brevibacillus parabrevis]MBU8711961.1 class II fructose-bisphosphate aldolase [Brevibacillus parabrevis]
MLTTLREVANDARKNQYAVPAFDCVGDIMVRTILDTAERLQSPVILMCLEHNLREPKGFVYLAEYIKAVAPFYNIPIVLHLDHAMDVDLVQEAIRYGFTSVMIDGSSLPFADNVALTRQVTDLARPHGISVEAELGHVGGNELGGAYGTESKLTEPHQVAEFVERTGVDALAVSIGTAHGVYTAEPNLNVERMREINQASPVPLVLHGGSGTPDAQVQAVVKHGISKVNLYADCRIAMAKGVKRAAAEMTRIDPLPEEMFLPIKQELEQTVEHKIRMLGSLGRA